MLTPIQNAIPETPARAFSDTLRSVRNRIENTFGILKGNFRILSDLRGLHYDPEFSAQIILACATLHNYLRNKKCVHKLIRQYLVTNIKN